MSGDYKVTLARPLQTYMALGDQVSAPEELGSASETESSSISPQRKRRAAELALERIANEKRDVTRGIFYGIFFIIFGAVFLFISSLRQAFISSDWLNLVGFGLGLVFVPLGIYFAYWFYKSSQYLDKDEEELGEEIIRST